MAREVAVKITANSSGFNSQVSGMANATRKSAADIKSAASQAIGSVDSLSAASARLARAQALVADSAGAVRLAEAKLGAVRNSSRSSAIAHATAEENLAKAQRGLIVSQRQLTEEQKKASGSKFFSSLTEAQPHLQAVGSALLKVGAAGVVGLGLSAKAAVDWESQFAGVQKTVNDSAEGFNVLEGQLRGLARTMPETHQQIAATAEAAGQLGVSRAALVPFVKTMIELGDTTNLSADEAATSMAQLMNIMGTAPSEVTGLGDALVNLGNNGASTERDILQMGQRIAGAGKSVDLTSKQVLGLASAVSSTGIEVEAGGTATSQNLIKMDKAVREGGDSLKIYAKTAGVTSAQFAKEWGTDPASALTQFVQGLANVKKSGGSIQGVLDSLGIKGQRAQDVYVRLAGATKTLGAQTNLLQQSFKDADNSQGALQSEADKRYQTNASRIRVSLNKIKDDAISLGGSLLPAVSSVSNVIGGMADAFQKIPAGGQRAIVTVGGIGTAALIATGGLASAASSVISLGNSFQSLKTKSPAAASAVKSVGKAVGALAIAAVAAQGLGALERSVSDFSFKPDSLANTVGLLTNLAKVPAANLDSKFQFKEGYVIKDKVDSIGSAFQRLEHTNFADTVAEGLDKLTGNTDAITGKIKAQFVSLDQGLVQLTSSGHANEAASSFKKIADQAQLQGVSFQRLTEDYFPQYAKAVTDATAANGYTIKSSEELTKIMGGEVPPALAKAMQGNAGLKAAVDAVTGSIKTQSQTVGQQLTALQNTAAGLLSLRSGQVGVQQAIDAADAALKQNGKTLDVHTAKGQQNRIALDNIAIASAGYTADLVKQHKSALTVVEANEEGRKSYISHGKAMGEDTAKVKDRAKALFALPKAVTSQVAVSVPHASTKQIHDLNVDIQKLPKEKRANIVTIAQDKGIKAARNAMAQLKDKQVIARSKGDLKGASAVKGAMAALKDRLVKAVSRGDKSGADKIRTAMAALRSKTVTAKVVGDASGAYEVRNAIATIHGKTVNVTIRRSTTDVSSGGKADGGLITHAYPGFADGGHPVTGRGGSREDNVAGIDRKTGLQTSWVSVGEFVTNAAAYAANQQAVEAINAGKGKRFRVEPLANGGSVKGYAAGGSINYSKLAQLLATEPSAFADITKAMSDIAAATKRGKKGLADLRTATDALKQAQQSFADNLKQQSAALSDPFRSKSTDIDDWLESFREGTKDLTTFKAQIAQLKKLGVSDAVLKSISDQGAVAGSELASQLIAGGKKLVDSVNKASTGLDKAADGVALKVGGVKGYATGGPISGGGTGTSDSITARVSNGEYIVNAASTAANRSVLDAINYGRVQVSPHRFMPAYAGGGVVQHSSERTYYAGDTIITGVIGDPDRWLRKAQQAKRDTYTMAGLSGAI